MAQDQGADVLSLGASGPRQGDLDPLIRQMPSQAKHVIFGYEAGPCGSWLSRSLTNKGDAWWVVAPSLLPQNPGDRVTTDRRDALHLARVARSGALPVVSVPKVEDEARRDLPRARDDALSDRTDATLRLNALLLRHDSRYTGRAKGGPAHLRGLSDVVWPTPAQHLVFQDEVRAVSAHSERLQRLQQELHEPGNAWRLAPVVAALQARRGVPCTAAVTLVAAMGALTRFESPRELMKVLGLIPAEHSCGEQRRQGSMPKAGHTQARRVLVAGAWAYRDPAKVSRPLPLRREKQPQVSQDIRWKAQGRLWKRSRRLVARGTQATVVTVAIARELSGFLGASAQEGPSAA